MFSPPKKFFFSLLDIGYDPEDCPDGSLLEVEIGNWAFNDEIGLLTAEAFTKDEEFTEHPNAIFFWEVERGIGDRFISPDFKTAKMYGFDEAWDPELKMHPEWVIENYHFEDFPIYTDVDDFYDRMDKERKEMDLL